MPSRGVPDTNAIVIHETPSHKWSALTTRGFWVSLTTGVPFGSGDRLFVLNGRSWG